MVSLHILSEEIRTILKWGTVILVIVISILVFTGVGKRIKEFFAPTPPPPPTVSFGKLPSIAFPSNTTNDQHSYTINTLTGTLPTFSDRANVYKIKKEEASLLALNRAKDVVSDIGLTQPEKSLTSSLYEWDEDTAPFRKLVLNIFSYDFKLTSGFLTDETVLADIPFLDEQKAISVAKDFLSSLHSLPEDVDESKTTTSLFTIADGQLSQTTSLSDTKVIRADFFQKDVDKHAVYYPNPHQSLIYALVAAGDGELQVVEAQAVHRKLAPDPGTYPIKTADDAYRELQEGRAYIASSSLAKEVQIKNVSIGYYITDSQQDYLLPIVVFEGDNGFFAYVPAVTSEWSSP